jgi:type IV pilus assembly protein PilB
MDRGLSCWTSGFLCANWATARGREETVEPAERGPRQSWRDYERNLARFWWGWGVITIEQADKAVAVAKGSGKRFGDVLVELNFTKEDQVAKALANQFGMEYVDLASNGVADKIDLKLIPDDLVKKHLILPMSKSGNRLQLLIHDPMDLELFDMLRFRLNVELDQKLTGKSQIRKYLDQANAGVARKFSPDQSLVTDSIDRSIDKSVD